MPLAPQTTIPQALQTALEHHQAGRLSMAEKIYRRVLEREPDNADALHLLGDVAHRSGDNQQAVRLMERALELQPSNPVFMGNLGKVLSDLQSLDKAERHLRAALAIEPQLAESHNNLGNVLRALGRSAEAEQSYRRALALRPDHFFAFNNLGVALQDLGRHGEAEQSFRQALACKPDFAEAYGNLGNLMREIGRPEMAEQNYRQMLSINPNAAGAHCNLGNALRDLGRSNEAEQSYRDALALQPDHLHAHNNLGAMLLDLGRRSEAEQCFRQALALNPDFSEAHGNLGTLLRDIGDLEGAERSLRKALALNPDLFEVHNSLGNVLRDSGRVAEAEASYRRTLALRPDHALACNNLGVALQNLGRSADAEQSFLKALTLNPNLAEAHSNLGNLLRDVGQLEGAEKYLRQALVQNPNFVEAHNNLGNVLRDLGHPAEAEHSFRRALALKPDHVKAHNNLGVALQNLGRLEEAEQCYRQALELQPDFAGVHSNLIFMLDLREDRTVSEQQAERRRWFAQHAVQHAQIVTPHENVPDPERRLRVGYVSADFYRHSASLVFSPVICRRDRAAFEVICYSGVTREDDVTARLRQAADVWRSTLGVSDEALAEQIRRDRIDILVDLSGHSSGNRLLVFARRPAPVQVTAWGHPTGTGLQTMDYLFSDPVMVPKEERALYAEQVIDLPCCVCYDAPAYLPEVSALPSLGGQPLTFGCVNRVEKISDRVIGLWGQILSALPEARLLLKDRKLNDAGLRAQILRRLADAGIGAGRVQLLGNSDHAEHLRTYHRVDLGLDPYPHGGGVSTLEALYMGVPVVTLKGATPASRVSAAILTGLQMQDWTAASDEQYVRIAIEAAANPSRLGDLRSGMRARMAASPLGDLQRYTQAVETVYRNIWQEWCARQL